ncbi:MAG: flagellar export chaperone FlgN [candidate division Zixibacteria bacterium]|nr:flagellar export chaperone FlgN [candidate division Zixibacteria bacterium]
MKKLVDILDQELETFNKFLILLDDQHKQIISRNIADLNKTDNELDLLSIKANDLEKRRMLILKENIKNCNLNEEENITLRDLLPQLDNVSSNRLVLLRESIIDAHKRIEEKSMRNKILIDKSRKLISESIRIINGRPSPIYNKPGPNKTGVYEGSIINHSV